MLGQGSLVRGAGNRLNIGFEACDVILHDSMDCGEISDNKQYYDDGHVVGAQGNEAKS